MLAAQIRRGFGRLRRAERPAPLRARLFVKQPCGLCEEARALLRPFQRRGRLTLELVDITADPELFRRYCFSIPVLEIEGGALLEWPFDRSALSRVLE